MTRNEAIELYEFLAVLYPHQYRSLTDKELFVKVESLAYTFRFVPLEEVKREYLNAFSRSKTEPHPSDVLKLLTPTEENTTHPALNPDEVYQRLQRLPEYKRLVQDYGGDERAERKVRRQARLAIQTGTFDELLFRLACDD